jgi:hypothetical protein
VTKPAPVAAARNGRRHRLTYNYTAGKDNGQIASSADAVTGETVAYQYDNLKRLVGATSSPLPPVNGTAWSEAYTYDGFGNLTAMSGNGSPPLSVSVNPATNQFLPSNVFNVAYEDPQCLRGLSRGHRGHRLRPIGKGGLRQTNQKTG